MYAVFFHPIWKNLHLTEIFYTGTACDACDKYEVWEEPLPLESCSVVHPTFV